MAPTCVAIAIAAAAGQPTSIVPRVRPKRALMAATASAIVPIKPVAKPKPNRPTPTIKPPRIDLPKPAPIMIPIKAMMIGITTEEPKPLM